MDQEGFISKEKPWGFRRSTIARREFLEAVSTAFNTLPAPRRGARQSRGRSRARDQEKQDSDAAVISAAPKRGRGGRKRAAESMLTPADEKSNEDEVCGVTHGLRCVAAEPKSAGKSDTKEALSDRAEDSDDLSLQEIRKRAISRRLGHEGNDGVKDTEYTDEGIQLVEHELVNTFDATDVSSQRGIVLSSSSVRGVNENSVSATEVQKVTGDQTEIKRAKMDSADEQSADNGEDASEKVDRDVSCRVCQQIHKHRFMICCDACRMWHHTDCVGISEAHARFMQKNGEPYTCSTCSEEHRITRKIRNANKINTLPEEIVEETSVQQEMKLEVYEVKEVKDAPKCIGPGCSNNALPESVYCGHQCIVQHAAMAMKCLSEAQTETKPAVPPAKPLIKSQKRSFLAKLFKVKIGESPPREEKVNTQEMVNNESVYCAEDTDPDPPPSAAAVDDKPIIKDKDVEWNTDKASEPTVLSLGNPSSEKTPVATLMKKSTPGRARKTMPGSPRLEILRGALGKNHGKCMSAAESSKAPPDDQAVVPPSSPLQIRQNIRRSLAEVLLQRINTSEHLDTTEREVEKLAVIMEKDMFNMCYTTNEVYRDKCQHLIRNLKDPKNKELCRQLLNKEISPIKLIHLSEQNIESSEDTAGNSVSPISSKEESTPRYVEEPLPVCQEKVMEVKSTDTESTSTHSDEKKVASQRKQSLARNLNSDVPDMMSSMLKDTTLQHKRHLFDLNCRICTGQVSADGDPETKKLKTEDNTEECVVHVMDEASPATAQGCNITESPASPTAEDCETQTTSGDSSPVLIPSVPIMSISRRDPRTAQFRQVLSSCTDQKFASSQLPPQADNVQETLKETELVQPVPYVPAPMLHPMPKSILTKPASASRLDASYGSSTSRLIESHAPSDEGTKQFLSKQDILWKGFLNMPTVAKFVTKGYLISGSSDFLKEDLPDTIQIGGRILPQTVWEYVELIKTSEAKEMSLIRFHPSSEEEEVAYVSLFSYFNSRRRFGVVSNVCKRIKDLYLIPLCAKQSIPSVLLPIQGAGLEQNHPNLLVGLVVCQKPKHPEAFPQEIGQKKSSLMIRSDSKEANNPTSFKTLEVGPHNTKACDTDILIKTSSNPCGSLNSLVSPDPLYLSRSLSCSSPLSSVLSVQKPITRDSADPSRDVSGTTPLQTLLHTLFGQKKQNHSVTECEMIPATDKNQQLQQMCKEANTMELSDNRPYDPEEYDPAFAYEAVESNSPTAVTNYDDDDDRPYDPEEEYNAVNKGDTAKDVVPKVPEESFTVNSDVAYDPEDETMFEEMQNYLADNAITHQKITICEQDNILNTTLTEQQKMLEELNRQIEEQKRQLEEQAETLRLQKEAIGVSMAHFSVSHALMSPPPQFGRDDEEEMDKLPYPPIIHEIRDPRTCGKTSKDAEDASEILNNENTIHVSLHTKECNDQTVLLDASSFSNQEELDCDKTLPSEGEPDNEIAQLQNTTKSLSEYRSETKDSRKSSRKSLRPESRSNLQDRSSSRASYKTTVSKDNSDKHSRSRHSPKHLSRRTHSGRRRLTSRTRHHHHHRDSSSPSHYRRRSGSSTRSHSSWRDRSSQEDSDRSRKTDEQQPRSSVGNAQSSHPGCEQRTKLENVEGSQKPNTSQNPGEKSLNNNAFDTNQPFSGHFEMMKTQNLPLNKTDHSSKRGLLPLPCAQKVDTAHSKTDHPLNSTTPMSQPPHDSESQCSDKEEPSNHTARFSASNNTNHKRDLQSMQRQNYLQNETGKLSSPGDYPQRAFQSQSRDFPQPNITQFNCRNIALQELPQKKTRDSTACEADSSGQLQMSYKQEGFISGELSHFDKQIFPSCIDQAQKGSQEHKPPQAHGNDVQEPVVIHFHHQKRPYLKGQHFHRDKFQFQQRESMLGPPPVDKGSFRPRSSNPSCLDKCKPSREPLSKMERSTFGHSQSIVPEGPSPGSCPFQEGIDTVGKSHRNYHAGGASERWFQDSQLSHLKGHASHRQFNSEHNTEGCASFKLLHKGHSNYRRFSHKQPSKSRGHPSPPDLYESESPNCPQTFGEEVEACRTLTCQSQTYPQEPTCAGSQSPEIKGQPRGPQQSGGFRGGDVNPQDGGNLGTCFARGHDVNAQTRAPRFDSPQQFMDRRAPSPVLHGSRKPSQNCDDFEDHNKFQSSGFPNNSNTVYSLFKKPEHKNRCESQNLWQPFECPTGRTNVRPLRGPLLPTPRGCLIRPLGNVPWEQEPNLHNESSRSQGLASVRHRPETSDISEPWNNGEKPSIAHNFHPRGSDNSDSQEDQRVGYESRRGQSFQDRSYGHPFRGTRGRNSSRRGGRRPRFDNSIHR